MKISGLLGNAFGIVALAYLFVGSANTAYAQTYAGKLVVVCEAEELPNDKIINKNIPVYLNSDGVAEVSEAVVGQFLDQSDGNTYEIQVSFRTSTTLNLLDFANIEIASVTGPFLQATAGISRNKLSTRMKVKSTAIGLSLQAAQFDDLSCRIYFKKSL